MATILQGPAIPNGLSDAYYTSTINNTSIPTSSSYLGASQNTSSTINYHGGTSISGQLNDHLKYQQQTAAQSYMSAALLFGKMEENISKNVLKMIGVQKNKDNMMVATICNVIDTLVSNFASIFDERFKSALDQMEIKGNKNNMNLMNNINNLNNKLNKNENLINAVIKKMDGTNNESKCAEKEKARLIEILLNEIDDIKSSIQQSGDLETKFIKNTEKWEKTMDDKLNEISNKVNIFETNVIKKENIMMENINNKLKKMENNLKNKLNASSDRMVNKLEEINIKILEIQNDFEESAMSNAVSLQSLKLKIDDLSKLENKKINNNENIKKLTALTSSPKQISNNNNKAIEVLSSSSLTSTSTPKQILNNDNKLLIVDSINKIDNNCLIEIYIDSDFQIIMGITTKCVIGIIKKIIISNNKNENENKNEYKIIIDHFGKIYKFFIKPKREMIIKDMIGCIANYNFMSFPYQYLYVNGDTLSESLSIDELISNNKIY